MTKKIFLIGWQMIFADWSIFQTIYNTSCIVLNHTPPFSKNNQVMPVYGYRASVCQGLSIIAAFFNSISGVALIVISIIVLSSPAAKASGLLLPAIMAAALGGTLLLLGIMNMTASIREHRPTVKACVILIICMAFALAGVLVFTFLTNKKVASNVREAYMNKMNNDERQKIHEGFNCCGMDNIKDAQSTNENLKEPGECKYTLPCMKKLRKELPKKGQLLVYILGIATLLQLFGAFASGCFMRKMRKKEEKWKKKHVKHVPLAEQAKAKKRKK
jgi:hypothetical protein